MARELCDVHWKMLPALLQLDIRNALRLWREADIRSAERKRFRESLDLLYARGLEIIRPREESNRADAETNFFRTRMTREQKLIAQMFDLYAELRSLGWKEPICAPRDGTEFDVIEAGSTGIHAAKRDVDGGFWVFDGEAYESNPILWRPSK